MTILKITELDSVSKYHILNRPDGVAHLAEHWASIPKVLGSITTIVRHIFQLAQCGCKSRVTPGPEQTLYIVKLCKHITFFPDFVAPIPRDERDVF